MGSGFRALGLFAIVGLFGSGAHADDHATARQFLQDRQLRAERDQQRGLWKSLDLERTLMLERLRAYAKANPNDRIPSRGLDNLKKGISKDAKWPEKREPFYFGGRLEPSYLLVGDLTGLLDDLEKTDTTQRGRWNQLVAMRQIDEFLPQNLNRLSARLTLPGTPDLGVGMTDAQRKQIETAINVLRRGNAFQTDPKSKELPARGKDDPVWWKALEDLTRLLPEKALKAIVSSAKFPLVTRVDHLEDAEQHASRDLRSLRQTELLQELVELPSREGTKDSFRNAILTRVERTLLEVKRLGHSTLKLTPEETESFREIGKRIDWRTHTGAPLTAVGDTIGLDNTIALLRQMRTEPSSAPYALATMFSLGRYAPSKDVPK